MRGKPEVAAEVALAHRNIPAYAGKTQQGEQLPQQPPEHPRVCGENFNPAAEVDFEQGTSPRMRGKR